MFTIVSFYIGRLYCPCSPNHSAHDSFQPVSIEIGWIDTPQSAGVLLVTLQRHFAKTVITASVSKS